MPAMSAVVSDVPAALDLEFAPVVLELGASAGLNLNWDRFAYAHPPWRRASMHLTSI